MKVIFCLIFFVAYSIAHPKADQHYTTKYDNFDLDAIIKNDRLLRAYVDCLLGTKKCTKEGEELKSKIYIYTYIVFNSSLNHFIRIIKDNQFKMYFYLESSNNFDFCKVYYMICDLY